MYTLKIGVCAGRHEIPVKDFVFGELSPEQITNPANLQKIAEKRFFEIRNAAKEVVGITNGQYWRPEVQIYATGLTVALLAIINVAKINGHSKITVMHYDRESGNYFPQNIL
jgi:hypothetical protein